MTRRPKTVTGFARLLKNHGFRLHGSRALHKSRARSDWDFYIHLGLGCDGRVLELEGLGFRDVTRMIPVLDNNTCHVYQLRYLGFRWQVALLRNAEAKAAIVDTMKRFPALGAVCRSLKGKPERVELWNALYDLVRKQSS